MRDIGLPHFDKVGQLSVGQGIINNGWSVVCVLLSPSVDTRFVDYGQAS